MRATKTNDDRSPALTARSNAALATVKQLLRDLPLDDAMSDVDTKAAQIGSRVPMEALLLAALILEGSPERFPQFDAAEARAAVEYIRAMAPVARALEGALGRVQKSVAKRRKGAADVTLALYAMMKGLHRIGLTGKEGAHMKQLRQLLTTYRQPRAEKVPKKEVLDLKKQLKGAKAVALARAKAEKAGTKLEVARAQTEAALVAAKGIQAKLNG